MANLADLQIGVGADVSGLGTDLGKVPAMAEEATDGIVSKFKTLGSKLAPVAKAAGAAAGAAMVLGAMEGIEREALGDKLAAQLDLTAGESQAAGEIAGSLYAGAYGESFGQVNEAVGSVISTLGDLGEADVEGLSAKALDLASAFDLDVNQAVTTAGTMLRNDLVADADEAFDLITVGLQSVPAAMRDEIFPVMEEYGGFFESLGMDGETAMELIVSASDGGVIAMDKVGDSLKELTIRGTDMSKTSVEAYEAAGLSAEEMSAALLAGGDTAQDAFGQIVDGLLSIEDPTERANAAIGLFGTPLEDLGTSEIPAFLESLQGMEGGLGDVEGAAARMGDTLNDNASTRIEGFKRGVEGFLASIVEAPGAIGNVATAAAGMGSILEPVGPAIAAVGFVFQSQLAGMATRMGAWVAATVSGAGSVIATLWTVASTYVSMGVRAVASMVTTAAQTAARWAFMGAQSLLHAAKMAAAWFIALGPIGWVTAAIIAIVALVIANWDKVSAWTKKAWTAVSDAVGAAVDWVHRTVSGWVDAVVGMVTRFGDKVNSTVRSAWDAVVSTISRAVDTVRSTVSGWVTALVGFVTNLRDQYVAAVTALRDRVVGFFAGLVSSVISTVSGWVSNLIGFVRGLRSDFAGTISDLISNVIGYFAGMPGRILSALGNVGSLLAGAGRNLVEGFIGGIGDMAGRAARAAMDVARRAVDAVKGFLGISSPSRVFIDLGHDTGDGFIAGLIDTERGVASAAAGLGAAAAGGVRVPGVSPMAVGGDGASVDHQVALLARIARAVEQDGTDWDRVARTIGRETAREQQMRQRVS